MDKHYWFVIISGILSGGILFGAQILANLGLSLYEISMLPSIFTIIILLPFVVLKKECRITKDKLGLLAIYGLISGVLALTQYGGVVLGIPVAVAVLLLYTQPFWTVILSKLILDEKITKYKILAVVIVLVGLVFLVNPFKIGSVGNLPGIIVGLVSGIFLSLWLILGRIAGKKEIHPVTTKLGYLIFMMIFLVIFYPIISNLVKKPSVNG